MWLQTFLDESVLCFLTESSDYVDAAFTAAKTISLITGRIYMIPKVTLIKNDPFFVHECSLIENLGTAVNIND